MEDIPHQSPEQQPSEEDLEALKRAIGRVGIGVAQETIASLSQIGVQTNLTPQAMVRGEEDQSDAKLGSNFTIKNNSEAEIMNSKALTVGRSHQKGETALVARSRARVHRVNIANFETGILLLQEEAEKQSADAKKAVHIGKQVLTTLTNTERIQTKSQLADEIARTAQLSRRYGEIAARRLMDEGLFTTDLQTGTISFAMPL